MRRASIVLFDLDGTLSDSAVGIIAAVRHAFAVNGLPPLDESTERAILGPPFHESLPPLIGTAAIPAVVAAYRERYSAGGLYETSVFDGVRELLEGLRAHGVTMAVATSKLEQYAAPIVEHLGLARYFDTVGGDELDGSFGTKALVIAKVLARLGHPDPATVLMVGDRSHDVEGARAHRIDCIGAGWGYGMPGELIAAAPSLICATPADVGRAFGLDGSDAEAS
jgi:phosphoglycolate phosphatase